MKCGKNFILGEYVIIKSRNLFLPVIMYVFRIFAGSPQLVKLGLIVK